LGGGEHASSDRRISFGRNDVVWWLEGAPKLIGVEPCADVVAFGGLGPRSTTSEDCQRAATEQQRASCDAVELVLGDRWRGLRDNELRLAEDRLDGGGFHDALVASGSIARCASGSRKPMDRRPRAAVSKEAGVGGAHFRRRKSIRPATCARPNTCSA